MKSFNYHFYAEIEPHGVHKKPIRIDGVVSQSNRPISNNNDYFVVKKYIIGLVGSQMLDAELPNVVTIESLSFLGEASMETGGAVDGLTEKKLLSERPSHTFVST